MAEVIDSHSTSPKMHRVFACQNPISPGRLPPWRQRPLRVHFAALQSYASYAPFELLLTAFDPSAHVGAFSISKLRVFTHHLHSAWNRTVSNVIGV